MLTLTDELCIKIGNFIQKCGVADGVGGNINQPRIGVKYQEIAY